MERPDPNLGYSRAEAHATAGANAKKNDGQCVVEANRSGTSVSALRDCAVAQIDYTRTIEADIDGVQLVNITSQDPFPPDSSYRALSIPFTFEADALNPFGIPAGLSQAVADGYWIFLPPLAPGVHKIHFSAVLPAFPFAIDVTYDLLIVQ